jgi:hypothetical protein
MATQFTDYFNNSAMAQASYVTLSSDVNDEYQWGQTRLINVFH